MLLGVAATTLLLVWGINLQLPHHSLANIFNFIEMKTILHGFSNRFTLVVVTIAH